jgi:hypothetical protein
MRDLATWKSPEHAAHWDRMRRALGSCTFPPGSAHKRFARDIQFPHLERITEAQRRHVIRLVYRYRRQIQWDLVPSKDAVSALDADWNVRRAEQVKATAEAQREKRARKLLRLKGPELPLFPQRMVQSNVG